MSVDAEKIVTKVLKVASLPEVVIKFDEAIKNPLTSNNQLEKILSEDSALASKVLRIANSALYNFPSKIDTILNAISIVGHKQLNDIILSCSVVSMFKDLPQDVIDMDMFWRHSLSVATASRILASSRREQNIEKFFTAGLLHDIGKLIMFSEIPSKVSEVLQSCSESNESMYRVEQDIIGFDHAKLGSMLMQKWKLPNEVTTAVNYHHNPSSSKGDVVTASIIHIADIISHSLQLGSSGQLLVPKLNNKAWDVLGLDVEIIGAVIEQLNVQYNDAVKYILN